MFTISYQTDTVVPDARVVLRTSVDGWADRGGAYEDGAWQFRLEEAACPAGLEFKFVIFPDRWMRGSNLTSGAPVAGQVLTYTDAEVSFPFARPIAVENGTVARTLLRPDLSPDTVHDVIVVGSGMGGGMLASALADAGADVLVLEAGSLLFPTHIGNLPRRLLLGQFQKHVWSLWQDFGVINYSDVDQQGYTGAQGFNLGGRSLFWGSLIPELTKWQLAAWPKAVGTYLLDQGGYDAACRALNAGRAPAGAFQDTSRSFLDGLLTDWTALDAPVGVQYLGATPWSLPAGIFSTADLLLEDLLVQDPSAPGGSGRTPIEVNLNHYVTAVTTDPAKPTRVTGVRAYDLLAREERSYLARTVVLCGGTIESAKLALRSTLRDPNHRIGVGITDHLIRYRHFVVPAGHPHASATESAKIVLQHPGATTDEHAFDIVVELGAEFNQGRYVDPNHLAEDENLRNGSMLCEIVFQYYSPLLEGNTVTLADPGGGDPTAPVNLRMAPTTPAQPLMDEADAIARTVFGAFAAQPVQKEDNSLDLQPAALGGVAHEVGTLRMASDGTGVVDPDLKFLDYDNLYACDNSVFPASPAANPSLTLVALALRLAQHLRQ